MVVEHRAAQHASRRSSAPLADHDETSALTGARVLVVDDNEDMRRLVAVVLEQAGARTIAVDSVPAALESFSKAPPPQLLISDIQLLHLDGYDLIRSVRSLPLERGGGIPAIALSGDTDVHTRQKAARAGFNTFLAKPVGVRQLLASARASLRASDEDARAAG